MIIPTGDRDRPGRAVPLHVPVTAEMTTVPIIQHRQRDSADPIGPHDPLANLLPAGNSKATRLFRPEPTARWDGWPAQAQPGGIGTTPPGVRQALALFGAVCSWRVSGRWRTVPASPER